MNVDSLDLEAQESPDRAAHVPTPRRFTAWDAVGVLALAAVMLAVERVAIEATDATIGRSSWIKLLTITSWVLVPAGLAALLWRDRPAARDVPRLLTAVWRDPPGPWVAFVLGTVVALPVLAFYAPIVLYDADSARLVAASRYIRQGGFDYFTETQEPYLPPLLLGPALLLRDVAGAKIVSILTLQVLGGTVSYVTYRITNTMLAAVSATISLFALSSVFERASRLPLYPTTLVLGYLGGWLCYRAMREADGVPWRLVIPAGVMLALTPEAHGTGQLFLALPVLLVPFAPTIRAALRTAGSVFLVVLVAMIPRILINLSVGGLDHVTSVRTDFWVTEGYLTQIQNDFFHYPGVNETVPVFLGRLPGRFMDFLGTQAWVVIVLAVLAWLMCGSTRARLFVASALAFFVLAVTMKRIPPFPRYYAPLWPGLAILSGVAVGFLARRRHRIVNLVAVISSLALAVAATTALHKAIQETDTAYLETERIPLRQFAAAINDGKGVLGNRAQQTFNSVSADIPTWGGQFLTEDELVTFLTWPSDEEVIEMMERHDIGWVFIDWRRMLEDRYNNTWLVPRYGLTARHLDEIESSPNFCRWLDPGPPGGSVLYKLGPCPEP